MSLKARRLTWLTACVAGACLLSLGAPRPAEAHHLLPVHKLDCSPSFPCPKEIHRRVDFWIEVFKGWGKEMAIFHDPVVPERVYRVLDTGEGCGGRVRKRIKANFQDIRNDLRALASRLEAGQGAASDYQRHLLGLFPGGNSEAIRRASRDIRCQSGVRDGFVAGLKRFNRFSDMVDGVLAENKLPPDIRYLPFVESSYNPRAYSKAGAAGLWQIMPATARSLGLEINATQDERLDPEAATRAAAKYLHDATIRLLTVSREKDPGISQEAINPFVITSYNYGVNGMRRAIRRIGPDYMSVLNRYKSPSFQVAVKNFYASFLAARHVARNASRYFPGVAPDAAEQTTTVVLQHATSMERIKEVYGVSESDLKPLNASLTRFVWNGWRLIPAGYRLQLPWRKNGWKRETAALMAMAPEKDVPGADSYTVRKGDTACGIARALRVNCSTLISANNLGNRALIRVGQQLIIPRKPGQSGVATGGRKSAPSTWTVKRGDTACGIARRTGVDCKELIRVNQLGRKARILVGQQLVIPGADYLGRNLAGLNADNRYIVQKGDSACKVARRFQVSCPELIRLNGLNRRAVIHPGQKLAIPGLVTPDTTETATRLATQSAPVDAPKGSDSESGKPAADNRLTNLLDTLPDLSIRVGSASGKPAYYIYVEVDETLGHYADWLGIGGSRILRQLNGLSGRSALQLGQRLRLPEITPETVSRFEQKRTEYHQVLSETLKENYQLVGIENYTVKSGESLWDMSQRLGFPLWLLYRLNPELRHTGLSAGRSIRLPQLRAI